MVECVEGAGVAGSEGRLAFERMKLERGCCRRTWDALIGCELVDVACAEVGRATTFGPEPTAEDIEIECMAGIDIA